MVINDTYIEELKKVIKIIPNRDIMQNKTILITGASGLIGSSVVDVLLEVNHAYSANINLILAGRNKQKIQNRFSFWGSGQYDFVYFDLLSDIFFDQAVSDIDYIIHCSGNCSPRLYAKEPVETLTGNMNGLDKILRFAREKAVSRVLFVSSSEVYGLKNERAAYKESDYGYVDILNPRACYPSAKRAAETLCASYCEEYGMDVVIVRPGHVYGAVMSQDDDRAPAQFVRNAMQGGPVILKSAGLQLRSYCHSLDTATAILTVLTSGDKGEAYNISNKNSIVTVREFAEAVADSAGTNIDFTDPADAEKKGYNLMSNSSLDSEKLESLGWRALIDLVEGTKLMIDSIK